jgi:radical SAM superfamily enzyme YgiQ (UPF0313 family)
LIAKLKERGPPKVIGFSNYSWTLELSIAFARAIKLTHPETIIVFGGPNYGLSDEEIESFWESFGDCIDFNIVLEGEVGFHALLSNLYSNDFNCDATKQTPNALCNVHFQDTKGCIVKAKNNPRIELDELPSPYVDTTLMEKFFDGKLIPLTHTTRGCPFKCTFCSEGAQYYNKVKQRTSRLKEEFKYIAERATAAGVYDLMLSDANYGMFAEDSNRADVLANIQNEFGYPKNVYVSTGKNQKARVLSVVTKLRGAVKLSASLQTTNETVLENIERKNISLDALSEAAREATDNNLSSYSELILGLPGETLDSHIKSILDVIHAGFTTIRIYQLILLPQTELNTTATRKLYGFETAFRPMPRSYGSYKLGESNQIVCEYEEIVVASNSMNPTDYAVARKIALMVDLVHNGKMFKEVMRLLERFSLRWEDFMRLIIKKVRLGDLPNAISKTLDDFILLMNSRLFESRELLLEAVSRNKSINTLADLAINEFAHFKAKVVLFQFDSLNNFVFQTLEEFSETSSGLLSTELIRGMREFCALSKKQPFDNLEPIAFECRLDEESRKCLWAIINHREAAASNSSNSIPKRWLLDHTSYQKAEISRLLDMYGRSEDGHSRIVMRSPDMDLFHRLPSEIYSQ